MKHTINRIYVKKSPTPQYQNNYAAVAYLQELFILLFIYNYTSLIGRVSWLLKPRFHYRVVFFTILHILHMTLHYNVHAYECMSGECRYLHKNSEEQHSYGNLQRQITHVFPSVWGRHLHLVHTIEF